MATLATRPPRAIDCIPPTEFIRGELTQLFREVQMLRALLRLAERKELAAKRAPESPRGGGGVDAA